jgi:hypothetical protein
MSNTINSTQEMLKTFNKFSDEYTDREAFQLNKAIFDMKLNYVKIGEDGIVELYCDHQMLSNLRLCEARFVLEHIFGVGTRGVRGWSLSFGIWLHHQLEEFYSTLKTNEGGLIDLPKWIESGAKRWYDLDGVETINSQLSKELESGLIDQEMYDKLYRKSFSMDIYAPYDKNSTDKIAENSKHPDKRYVTLGGLAGAKALLAHYWAFFGQNNAERFRVVATEVGFGKDKEVPIIDESLRLSLNLKFRAYMCGRIDLLIDDGNSIGPVDHKSTGYFTGKEHSHYNPHEGPTGYVLAIRKIINDMYPDLIKQGRLCDSIWINHISLKVDNERFKRTRLRKSQSQLDEYIARQQASFIKLWELLMETRVADWNTSVCDNIFHYPCQFKALHEVAPENRADVLRTYYVKIDLWNPYRAEPLQ